MMNTEKFEALMKDGIQTVMQKFQTDFSAPENPSSSPIDLICEKLTWISSNKVMATFLEAFDNFVEDNSTEISPDHAEQVKNQLKDKVVAHKFCCPCAIFQALKEPKLIDELLKDKTERLKLLFSSCGHVGMLKVLLNNEGNFCNLAEHARGTHRNKGRKMIKEHKRIMGNIVGRLRCNFEDCDSDGRNILHHAVSIASKMNNWNQESIDWLIERIHDDERGFDGRKKMFMEELWHKEDKDGITPLELASQKPEFFRKICKHENFKFFMRFGLFPKIDLDFDDDKKLDEDQKEKRKFRSDKLKKLHEVCDEKSVVILKDAQRDHEFEMMFGWLYFPIDEYSKSFDEGFKPTFSHKETATLGKFQSLSKQFQWFDSNYKPKNSEKPKLYEWVRAACTVGDLPMVKWLIDEWKCPVDAIWADDDSNEPNTMKHVFKNEFISLSDAAVIGDKKFTESLCLRNTYWNEHWREKQSIFFEDTKLAREVLKEDDHFYIALYESDFGPWTEWDGKIETFAKFIKSKIPDKKDLKSNYGLELRKWNVKAHESRLKKCESRRIHERLEVVKYLVGRFGARFMPRLELIILMDSVVIFNYLLEEKLINLDYLVKEAASEEKLLEAQGISKEESEGSENGNLNVATAPEFSDSIEKQHSDNHECENHDECPICYEPLKDLKTFQLRCGHTFCFGCLLNQLKQSKIQGNDNHHSLENCSICRCPSVLVDFSKAGSAERCFLIEMKRNAPWFLIDENWKVKELIFMFAICNQSINLVDHLIKMKLIDPVKCKHTFGANAMHYAVQRNKPISIKYLCGNGYQELANELALLPKNFHLSGNQNAANYIPNFKNQVTAISPFHLCCLVGSINTLLFFRHDCELIPENQLDSSGRSWVHYAQKSNLEKLKSEAEEYQHEIHVKFLPGLIKSNAKLEVIVTFLKKFKLVEESRTITTNIGFRSPCPTIMAECMEAVFETGRVDVLIWLYSFCADRFHCTTYKQEDDLTFPVKKWRPDSDGQFRGHQEVKLTEIESMFKEKYKDSDCDDPTMTSAHPVTVLHDFFDRIRKLQQELVNHDKKKKSLVNKFESGATVAEVQSLYEQIKAENKILADLIEGKDFFDLIDDSIRPSILLDLPLVADDFAQWMKHMAPATSNINLLAKFLPKNDAAKTTLYETLGGVSCFDKFREGVIQFTLDKGFFHLTRYLLETTPVSILESGRHNESLYAARESFILHYDGYHSHEMNDNIATQNDNALAFISQYIDEKKLSVEFEFVTNKKAKEEDSERMVLPLIWSILKRHFVYSSFLHRSDGETQELRQKTYDKNLRTTKKRLVAILNERSKRLQASNKNNYVVDVKSKNHPMYQNQRDVGENSGGSILNYIIEEFTRCSFHLDKEERTEEENENKCNKNFTMAEGCDFFSIFKLLVNHGACLDIIHDNKTLLDRLVYQVIGERFTSDFSRQQCLKVIKWLKDENHIDAQHLPDQIHEQLSQFCDECD